MKDASERILGDLQALVHELEEALRSGSAAEGLDEAGGHLKEGLARAREKLEELEARVEGGARRGARATDEYLRSNPWRSVGIVAAAAFLLGALLSRRHPD